MTLAVEQSFAVVRTSQPPPPEDVYARGMEHLIVVSQELARARSLDAIQRIVRSAARQLTGADGASLVLRDEDSCFYADEDAIAPLWKGKRFPLTACVSGWVMLNRKAVLIEDIYRDARIPAEAYRPTFVKSLAMVPIRTQRPIGAIGNYWACHRMPSYAEIKLLQALADSTAIAMENVQRYAALEAALELRQTQKMDAIGQLAAGIAHDFNNVLTVILSYGNLLAQGLPEDDALRSDVAEIVGAGERAATLTQQLLTFSRQQLLQPRLVRMDRLLCGVRETLERLLGAQIRLSVEQAPDLHATFADPGQLEQLLLNLAVNARDAMPDGGTLRIQTCNAGDYVCLTVSDTGTGMPDDIRERIFEPFFTTKEKGKGAGLGLSTVYGIVKQSKGQISVTSELGKGSTFVIHLPRDAASAS